jgi:hypothetical protein
MTVIDKLFISREFKDVPAFALSWNSADSGQGSGVGTPSSGTLFAALAFSLISVSIEGFSCFPAVASDFSNLSSSALHEALLDMEQSSTGSSSSVT